MTDWDVEDRRAQSWPRLERIENKIDRISEIMVGLARAEENINQIEEKYNHSLIREKALDKKISLLSGHIDEINKKINASQYTMDLVGKVFWIAIMASIGVMASQIIPGVTA